MFNKGLGFVMRHAYIIGGTIVIGLITLVTGSFTVSVIGYTVSYGLSSIMDKIVK